MKRGLMLVGLLALAMPCAAITVVGTPPPAGKGIAPKATSAKNEQARDDSAGLRKGTIEALNVNGGTFNMYGQKMTFDATRVKIFGRDGKATNVFALHKGGKLRFTMDASDPMHRRVAVIYVD
jgi:hypothetical protein